MFKIFSAVANNMSEGTYLKSVNNLEFKENAIEDNQSNNPVDIIDKDKTLRELDKYQNGIRHENLRIFRKNILNARLEQFLIVSLPALLVAGSITLWAIPAKYVKTESIDTYKRYDTVISDDQQINFENEKLYYSTFFGRDFVEKDKASDFSGSSTQKRLEIYVTENLEGFLAKLTINSDGSLSLNDIDKGAYLNLNDYDFSNAKNIDEKYVSLFDKTIDIMLDSGYLSDESIEELKKLSESDKKEVVAKIIEYKGIGETEVDVYGSRWFWRIVLSIIAGLYLWAEIYVLRNEGLPEFYELTNNNGELVESEYTKDLGLFYLGTKYKEAFMAAERDRIKHIYEIADRNLIGSSRDSMLTSYEKKLIFTPRKDG